MKFKNIIGIIFWLAFFVFFLYKLIPKWSYLTDGIPEYMNKDSLFKKSIFALHIFSGIVVYCTAVLQFTPFIRKKYISFHRKTGKLYISASLLCIMSLYFVIPGGLCTPCRLSHWIVTNLWLLFVVLAFYFIRRKKIVLHQRMMISGFICAAYFVTVRVIDVFFMPFFKAITNTDDQAFLVSDITVWALPLILFWLNWLIADKLNVRLKHTSSV